jgi:outer membrane protein assembly factor BamB
VYPEPRMVHVLYPMTLALALVVIGTRCPAADWPQFMRNPAHTGDAADEELRLPLGLAAQVRLDDAVMTSPAVVGGRVYVIDQMGTAYCIDTRAGRIVWKTSPDAAGAMGANTSSPCVAQGRVCFGTTAGNFYILNARDGKVVKTVNIGAPILSAPTFANGSVYFQALDAVLRCVDLDGQERWKWDHYARFRESAETAKAMERLRAPASVDGMYGTPNYGGGDVAVSGKKVVTSFGWDIVCLEDAAAEAKLLWCNRAPTGGNGTAPMSSSISGDWVYNAGMGADGVLAMSRLSLRDGQVAKTSGEAKNKDDKVELDTEPWSTPAVRGAAVAAREYQGHEYRGQWYSNNGILFYDFEAGKTLVKWRDDKDATPIITSHALAKEHLVATTLRAEVLVFNLAAKPGAQPFRFRTPNGKGIGSSPAISGGRIYFGCDDGYFYVLGSDGNLRPTVDDKLTIHEPRGKIRSATGRMSGWPSTGGNAANTFFLDDPDLKPPLRVRWATRGFGHFKAPCIAREGDLVSVTLQGLVTCQEQATGRTRWRVAMPGPESWTGAGLLADAGRLFVARPIYGRPEGVFHCLDLRTGRILWSVDIGGRHIWERSSPVVAGDLVAFGSTEPNRNGPPGTMIKAWNVETGKAVWQVDMNVSSNRVGDIAGCTDGKAMYFTAGVGDYKLEKGEKKGGEAVAIEAKTGKVLWRSTDPFGSTYPVLAGDRLLLNEYFGDLSCVSAADGKLLWKRKTEGYSRFSVGADFLVMRGYGGHGAKVRLEDGKDYPGCEELGGETHACGAVALTPNCSFAITLAGLNVREVQTGKLLWHSPGFAPRACVNPVLANGRVFWTSGASGMIYCWEPASPDGGTTLRIRRNSSGPDK